MTARPGAGPASTWGAIGLRALALGAAYAAVSVTVSVVSSFGTEAGAAFWPGAGLTVAALLLRPRREWPALLAAVAVAEISVDLATGFGFWASISFAVANCAEPVLAATLLRQAGMAPPDLRRTPDLLRFVGAAVVAGPALGALLGTALPALLVGDPWFPRLPRWWVGDGVGVLVVAPFLLTRGRPRTGTWPQALGPGAALLGTALVAAGPWSFPGRFGLQYLLIPAVVLVALRLRTGGAAAGTLLVGLIVETVSAASYGPFSHGEAGGRLVAAQMFLVMCALTALIVAALTNHLVERERSEAVLRAQAQRDSLTGLGNRRLLEERLDRALARLARHPGLVAVICVDLDGFKAVNDTFGHAAGDAVLVEAARRIERTVRVFDTPARLGGDEFLVVAEDLSGPADAASLATRLTEALALPLCWEDQPLTVTASVGYALTEDPATDRKWLLAEADRAMYRAKRAGRHVVVLTDPEPVALQQAAEGPAE